MKATSIIILALLGLVDVSQTTSVMQRLVDGGIKVEGKIDKELKN
jgi:hypothetical protein